MKIDRRTLLGGIAATLAARPLPSFAESISDATGRAISTPGVVQRVYPAGPPAAMTAVPPPGMTAEGISLWVHSRQRRNHGGPSYAGAN